MPVSEVIVNVTLAVLDVTVLPNASCTVTFGCTDHAVLRTPPFGCCVNATDDAAAALTVNVDLVALVSPALDATSVYPVPALLIDRAGNVATPFVALTDTGPDRVPPPGFVPIAMAIGAPLDVTTLLPASWIVATTAGLMATPATTEVG
ncbi:MAG: hypothetical protein ABW073_01980, partial [Acidimicrobiia bacterium]